MNMNESMGVSHFTGKEMEQTQNKKEAHFALCREREEKASRTHVRRSSLRNFRNSHKSIHLDCYSAAQAVLKYYLFSLPQLCASAGREESE
jgi:hypothetical protein